MEATELVLQTMREAGTPLAAGKIAELSGLDRKVVDKAMKDLKAAGAIMSPVRGKWEPAEK
jgi:GTP-sensing pleiotropic transcriptional regulator CodY